MKVFPEYCENIIVGVTYKRGFHYYVTETDIWFLDFEKRYNGFHEWYKNNGRTEKKFLYDMGAFEEFCGKRFGISVVDEKTAARFLDKLKKYETFGQEIKKWYDISDENEKSSFMPILYVDFDKKTLYSYCPEPIGFENYVPNGWRGIYKNFYDLIPESEKWWE